MTVNRPQLREKCPSVMYNGGLPDILLVAKPTYVAAIKELVVADTNGDGIAELVVET